jgi:hypothetical protein
MATNVLEKGYAGGLDLHRIRPTNNIYSDYHDRSIFSSLPPIFPFYTLTCIRLDIYIFTQSHHELRTSF